jgi:uncharacterized protein (DUF885 family)
VHALPVFVLAFSLLSGSEVPRSSPESDKFHQLIDSEWERRLAEEPTLATRIGDRRYNDRWEDRSLEAIAARRAHSRDVLAVMKAIDRAQLSPPDQLNYDLFLRNVSSRVEEDRFHGEYLPINTRHGPYSEIAEVVRLTPLAKVKDYEDLVKRLRAFPALIDHTLVLMRKGMEDGVMPPKVILREVSHQMSLQIHEDVTRTPVYQTGFLQMPSSISGADQERLREEAKSALRDSVVPAIRKLQTFFLKEYEPKARNTVGISALPDGAAWYAVRVKTMTTTDLSAEQIHEIGLSEVKRIRAEMEQAMRRTKFHGDLQSFFNFLRTDPQFFFKDKDLLLLTYRDIAKRIDPELPKLFRTLPRMPYGVVPVPAYSEKSQTTAYYQPGSVDAGRAGYFYANTYDLKSRPKWEMEALTLHEAVPGHHLQIAIAQELRDVPKFRRFGGYTAYTEGWGLYAESLGSEIGLYKDPYSRFGQLTYEMWRAIRLVVDTGMHSKGWTRDQAIRFFQQNTGKTQHDIEVEVDRYIAWPGQALAYKLGELKIKELRIYATQQLGDQFDLRDFHDQVLGAGPLPLSVLDARIRQWVTEQLGKQKQAAMN